MRVRIKTYAILAGVLVFALCVEQFWGIYLRCAIWRVRSGGHLVMTGHQIDLPAFWYVRAQDNLSAIIQRAHVTCLPRHALLSNGTVSLRISLPNGRKESIEHWEARLRADWQGTGMATGLTWRGIEIRTDGDGDATCMEATREREHAKDSTVRLVECRTEAGLDFSLMGTEGDLAEFYGFLKQTRVTRQAGGSSALNENIP